MMDVKYVIYERNGNKIILNIDNECTLHINDEERKIDNNKVLNYLGILHTIIVDWNNEYINTKVIDGIDWSLLIVYTDGEKKYFEGKSNYPSNFEALEKLNQELISEV